MENEVWKDIPNYPSYKASNLGRLLSYKRDIKGKLLKCANFNGYRRVLLKQNNKFVSRLVHQIIAITFIENPYNYKEINHINLNKSDNRVENLEWCDRKQNMSHFFKYGNRKVLKGEMVHFSKLTEKNIKYIRKMAKKVTNVSLSKKFNVTPTAIGLVIKNKNWKHV